jgi:SRSO17 transposase
MAQAARRSAWPSSEVEQAEQQARVWADGLVELHERIGGRLGRVEPRRRALAYLQGLLSQVERKNSWWLAEEAGEQTQTGCSGCSVARGGTPTGSAMTCATTWPSTWDPHAVLVLDETGVVQEGWPLGRVQRQYTGTVGKQENCQVAVFLAYATLGGVALVDRDLYPPKSWTQDPARCRTAGIPDEVVFKTKPQLGQAMLERAIAVGVPFGWVTGDTV